MGGSGQHCFCINKRKSLINPLIIFSNFKIIIIIKVCWSFKFMLNHLIYKNTRFIILEICPVVCTHYRIQDKNIVTPAGSSSLRIYKCFAFFIYIVEDWQFSPSFSFIPFFFAVLLHFLPSKINYCTCHIVIRCTSDVHILTVRIQHRFVYFYSLLFFFSFWRFTILSVLFYFFYRKDCNVLF